MKYTVEYTMKKEIYVFEFTELSSLGIQAKSELDCLLKQTQKDSK